MNLEFQAIPAKEKEKTKIKMARLDCKPVKPSTVTEL